MKNRTKIPAAYETVIIDLRAPTCFMLHFVSIQQGDFYYISELETLSFIFQTSPRGLAWFLPHCFHLEGSAIVWSCMAWRV